MAKKAYQTEIIFADIEEFENIVTTSLKMSDNEPKGCLIAFSNKGITFTSAHPDNISALTIFLPKEELTLYKTQPHKIWMTKQTLEQIKKTFVATHYPMTTMNINENIMNLKCGKITKRVVLGQLDPADTTNCEKIVETMNKIEDKLKDCCTIDMDTFAHGIKAIEVMLRKHGDYNLQGSSIEIKGKEILLSVKLELDEIEVTLENKSKTKSKTKIDNTMNIVELSATIKNMKKLVKEINMKGDTGQPILITGRTEKGLECKYILAPITT